MRRQVCMRDGKWSGDTPSCECKFSTLQTLNPSNTNLRLARLKFQTRGDLQVFFYYYYYISNNEFVQLLHNNYIKMQLYYNLQIKLRFVTEKTHDTIQPSKSFQGSIRQVLAAPAGTQYSCNPVLVTTLTTHDDNFSYFPYIL